MRFFAVILLVLCQCFSIAAGAADRFRVAIITDGPDKQPNVIEKILLEELLALTDGEFDVSFKRFEANWSLAGIEQRFQEAYADPAVDMLLVTGIAANQIGVVRKNFPKPTFLPVVFDVELMGAPSVGTTSGKTNLSYLSEGVHFKQNLANFRLVAPIRKVALLGEELVFEAIPRVGAYAKKLAAEAGIELLFIGHNGGVDDLVSRIPSDVDGVMMAVFPRMPEAEFQAMIDDINRRKLPSFSLLGSDRVAQGMLVSDAIATDYKRLGRRNALNMQAVMLGEKAADQVTVFEGKNELTLNMETARKIGLSPSFDVLSEAILLNALPAERGPVYTLADVGQMAVERNLQLSAEAYGVTAGREEVASAKAGLLPQLSLGSGYTRRKKSAAVVAGQLAEKTLDGSASLSQLLYSDSAWANAEIQRHLQVNREASFQQSRLEIVQAATVAYLNVLRAQTQLRVQQDNLSLTKTNLDLARDRVRVGSSSAADVYRWESRIASDRSSLLQARAAMNQARENLNRILYRPITEPFRTATVRKSDPFAMNPDEFDQLIDNPRDYGFYTRFILQQGLELSPELAQLAAQLKAKKREITNRTRAFWLPDFSLSSRYGENFDQSGVGVGPGENASDWDVAINASIPLFDGGTRRAALSRARLELKQLQVLYDSAQQQVEQQIRANIHAAVATYANIDLSAQAARAGKKNLELVTDSYAKGVVSIIDLLDAQNASLQADQAAANAVYDFLIDIMNMQRSVGLFEFMLPEAEKRVLAEQLRDYIASKRSGRNSTKEP